MKNYADKQHILLIYFEQFYLLGRHSKNLVSLKFIFYSDDFVNQYTAKDTVGKEYGDLAANIGPTSEKPFTNTFSNQSFNYSRLCILLVLNTFTLLEFEGLV